MKRRNVKSPISKPRYGLAISLATAMLVTACATTMDGTKTTDNTPLSLAVIDQSQASSSKAATSTGGMVSSAHPLATLAGRLMLEQGGNAADAATAVGFALSVVEPSMSGLGGRGQILLQTADGKVIGYDAMTELGEHYVQPSTMVPTGHSIVGVAGVPAGLLKLHKLHGRLPIETVMAPAIEFAEHGHTLMPGEVSRRVRGKKDIMADPVLSDVFVEEDGTLHDAGDLFIQRDQAATLKAIRDGGHDAFYKGEIARTIAADMTAHGGSVTYDSLANYKVIDARIVHTNYRGFDVWGVDAPGNGTSIIESLNILKSFDVENLDEPSWALLLSKVTGIAIWDTLADGKGELMERNVSAEWAATRAAELELPLTLKTSSLASEKNYDLAMIDPTAVDWAGESNGEFSHHTTHHVAADSEGMTVSITQTLGPNLGAKVMTKGLGFLHAQTGGTPATFGGVQGPGDRPRTNIAPTIISKDGKMIMALGAAGGFRIPTAIVEVISRYIDQGMSLQDAVVAPRSAPKIQFLPTPGFAANTVQMEMTPINGWSTDVIEALEQRGVTVDVVERYSVFARVNALAWDEKTNNFVGVADADWEGVSAGPSR